MRKRNAIFLLLLALLAWKTFRTDWIVSTNYKYYDADPPPSEIFSVQTFTPPVAPIWYPPKPQDFDPTATTWNHSHFFYSGGAGGPTEEPELNVHWKLILIKLVIGAVAGFLLILVTFRSFKKRM